MKIIKRSLPEKEIERLWTCIYCKSIISSKPSEGKFFFSPRNESYYIFICPVCNEKCWIDANIYSHNTSQNNI